MTSSISNQQFWNFSKISATLKLDLNISSFLCDLQVVVLSNSGKYVVVITIPKPHGKGREIFRGQWHAFLLEAVTFEEATFDAEAVGMDRFFMNSSSSSDCPGLQTPPMGIVIESGRWNQLTAVTNAFFKSNYVSHIRRSPGLNLKFRKQLRRQVRRSKSDILTPHLTMFKVMM